VLFTFFALVLWGASRSQKPQVAMKVASCFFYSQSKKIWIWLPDISVVLISLWHTAEHHVPELHHPGGHGRVAGAHGHGHHQRHRQVHLQEHRHLLRHPRRRRPIHAILLPAQSRRRRRKPRPFISTQFSSRNNWIWS
jgi:hypothetical protein